MRAEKRDKNDEIETKKNIKTQHRKKDKNDEIETKKHKNITQKER
jgi:hypothetical protein